MSVQDLERKVEQLGRDLRAAEVALNQARIDASPIKVGDVVLARYRYREWRLAIVRRIEPNSWGNWYRVSFKKKNGEWADRMHRVFNDVQAAPTGEDAQSTEGTG